MYSPGRGVRLRGSARTNTGRVRENNEDHVHLWGKSHFILAIVADGMGGAVAGEEASRIAVETIHEKLVENDQTDFYDSMSADILSDKLRDVIRAANHNIVKKTQTQPELRGMGTTVTLAMVRNTYAIIGHVGDSRAYLVDGHEGSISQITSDHSFVEAMVAAGHITRAEAEDHPMRNVLYRALGQAEEIDVDVYHSYLRVGDRLVMCSDGLTLHVKPNEIAQLVLAENRPEVASQKLIDLANERGGRDNVTVIIISVEEDSQSEKKQKINLDASKGVKGDAEDTWVLGESRPFVSSESENAPRLENRDGKSNALKLGKKQKTPLIPVGVFPSVKRDNSGEGRDVNKPDQ